MKITLAEHYGMCFGVRDAVHAATELASEHPVTILGQLVHNPVVRNQLDRAGAKEGNLHGASSAPTQDVVITAHGASDADRQRWEAGGHRVTDTTCPLVHKAHRALATLVASGYHPVVIGKPGHVEVRGLTGDFPQAVVIETIEDITTIPELTKIGVISQTTQPLEYVRSVVSKLEEERPNAEIRFVDTVCQPTKNRQRALQELCANNQVIVVVGGHNSNNTRQLVKTSEALGCRAHHVESPADLQPEWFADVEHLGVTAGTSTLKETVAEVVTAIQKIHPPELATPA